jgi:hypothetical protein
MNELYLHYLWKMKRLPIHQMKLVDDRNFSLLDFGSYNEFENGPDFKDGSIILDELTWFGSIEIHVNASDWYKHKHQIDPNYDNVILHVVYNADCDVIQNGRILPTLELKSWIDLNHFKQYQFLQKNKSSIPCESLFHSHPIEYWENMKNRAIINRLTRKAAYFHKSLDDNLKSVFLQFIARAFGSNLNQQPFEQLLNSIDWETIHEFSLDEFVSRLNFLAFSDESHLGIQWKTKGFHSVSNVPKRVEQFAVFLYNFEFKTIEFQLKEEIIIEKLAVFFKHYGIYEKSLFTNVLINAVVPYLFGRQEILDPTINFQDQAIAILKQLPTESNVFVKKWKNMNVISKTAYDSQAALEIYQQFCTRKQCLNCTVGIKILNP